MNWLVLLNSILLIPLATVGAIWIIVPMLRYKKGRNLFMQWAAGWKILHSPEGALNEEWTKRLYTDNSDLT